MQLDTNENKKKMCQIYNEVSKELFGFGTTLLKASVDDRIVTFYAKHRRSPRSAALEGEALNSSRKLIFECLFYIRRYFGTSLRSR